MVRKLSYSNDIGIAFQDKIQKETQYGVFQRPVEADILVRGYSGWNTRRALEVIEKLFPKEPTIASFLQTWCSLLL
ncbi:GDSL esterase/lipase At2g38180-like [Amborella trichopoda]|uniref:GDSL esterase/lipase At2g38180-like n=1 Tax=Amborella trichopoda TaxID=13333 RepID=UPI0009BD9A54|nr:GDSL esterase/lipase At2g38180-like [Amborella trichopoda]|eukprot:XP_020526737.1 GDSL esterase/lipase At2g38180-like [Amborella trichopoda]